MVVHMESHHRLFVHFFAKLCLLDLDAISCSSIVKALLRKTLVAHASIEDVTGDVPECTFLNRLQTAVRRQVVSHVSLGGGLLTGLGPLSHHAVIEFET